ncbi:hypothetical protein RIF29_08585 [Crotalaria pallida]|uniref:Uncharacterized protein n=1 Tax=Crotalaria pallida TaxID=3830 RepID=A0AAN9ILJ6_CROPI
MNHMQWSELALAGGGCKDHPNDNKLPGVCSFCLRDKLSQLYNHNNNNNNNNNLVDSLSSSTSSPASPQAQQQQQQQQQPYSPAPNDASPYHATPAYHRRLHRNASHATNSVSCMINFNYELNLKKSKSLAFASRNRIIRGGDSVSSGGRTGRKKDGFWSKVIKLTKKDSKEASSMNSRIGREGRA